MKTIRLSCISRISRLTLSINYIRDKRSPTPNSEAVSRVMSANRPRDTKPELTLRKALYQAGHRGYQINYRIALTKTPLLRKEGSRDPKQFPRLNGTAP